MNTYNAAQSSKQKFLLERKEARHKLDKDAVIRSTSQGRIGGRVLDISESGCKLDLYRKTADYGQAVTIKLENLESLAGKICWVTDNIVGVEFERPLHPAVVEHLSKMRFQVEIG